MKLQTGTSWQQQLLFILLFLGVLGCDSQGTLPQTRTSAGGTATIKIPSHPLTSERDVDMLMKEIGDARVVLLGEASHGTADYYIWRAAITKRLIQEKGFDFVAVEGEWADSYRVNNFIKGPRQDSAAAVNLLRQFNRWPTWMWGNYEVASLMHWMNTYNQGVDSSGKAGFFGLDVYCLWESMAELMPYLEGRDPAMKAAASRVHKCFQPYGADPERYAQAVYDASADCRAETSRLLKEIRKWTNGNPQRNEAMFVMEQNALVALNAERYYRAMVHSNAESWNVRDRHMTETLKRLLQQHGPGSKAVVWEHNTHVGDARYTDMAQSGEVNVGQLIRQELGQDQVYIVGFGSYTGTVIAADRWGDPHKVMNLPEGREGSWERMLHVQGGGSNMIVLSRELRKIAELDQPIGHRAVGVIYRPKYEAGNYVPSVMPKRYDAFMFIDRTSALHPISIPVKGSEPPDLYPSGT